MHKGNKWVVNQEGFDFDKHDSLQKQASNYVNKYSSNQLYSEWYTKYYKNNAKSSEDKGWKE